MLARDLKCDVDSADSLDEALQKLQSRDYDLCLVNRELAFEGSSGLDLISAAKEEGVKTPIMLVSDRKDAQEKAVKMGALPGFGKSKMNDPETIKMLKQALDA